MVHFDVQHRLPVPLKSHSKNLRDEGVGSDVEPLRVLLKYN